MVTRTFGVAVQESPFALLGTTTGAKTWSVVAEPSPALPFVTWGFGPGSLVWVRAARPKALDDPNGTLAGSRLWTWDPPVATWASRRLDPSAGTVVQFLTRRVAMAWRVYGRGAGTSRIAQHRSVNSGTTWSRIATRGGGDPTGLAFVNSRRGWMTGFVPVGGDWDVESTSDGGASWRPVSLAKPRELASQEGVSYPPILCSATLGYVAVQVVTPPGLKNDMVVYETADTGASWTAAVTLPYGLIACGSDGVGHVSTARRVFVIHGDAYTHVRLPRPIFQVTDFLSADAWYAQGEPRGSGAPGSYVTRDAGARWSRLPVDSSSR